MREVLGLLGALLLLGVLGDGILRVLGAGRILGRMVWVSVAVWIGGGTGLLIFQVPGVGFVWGTGVMVVVAGFLQFLVWWKKPEFKVENQLGESGPTTSREGGVCFVRARRPNPFQVAWWVLVGAATVWVGLLGAQAGLVSPVEQVTGLGNWLFKAKLILAGGGMPGDFFTYTGENRHLGYPPRFPILCAWVGWWMGGLDLLLIRLVPWLAYTGAFFLLAGLCGRSLRGLGALVGLTALFSSNFGLLTLRYFFAEPLLLLGVAVALVVLQGVLKNSEGPETAIGNRDGAARGGWVVFFLVLGPLSWMKQEGAVVAALLAGFVWLQAGGFGVRRWKVFLGWFAGVLIWVLPWRLAAWAGGVSDENFSMGRLLEEGAGERLKVAAEVYFAHAWKQGENFAGAWWLLPVAVGLAMVKKNAVARVLVGTELLYVAVVVGAMAGSLQEDFHWHLMAAVRVLLLPSALVILSFGVNEIEIHETKLKI